jgi:hypothetical protein
MFPNMACQTAGRPPGKGFWEGETSGDFGGLTAGGEAMCASELGQRGGGGRQKGSRYVNVPVQFQNNSTLRAAAAAGYIRLTCIC